LLTLLVQRGSVLLLRPAALLAEGFLLSGESLLVFVLPAAAMALTMSSVPVYLKFYRSLSHHDGKSIINRNYTSGLSIIIAIAVLVLSLVLTIFGADTAIFIGILATFIIEKFSDELTRYFEFNKAYGRWFVVQSSRSLWLFIPIALALGGAHYETAFWSVSVVAALAMAVQFFLSTGLRPSVAPGGWSLISENAAFLSSSAILAAHRQLPRLAVAGLFPQMAHVFQAMAQASQSVSLVFNVRYQVPYRKLIARRTVVFERMFRGSFGRIAFATVAFSAGGGVIAALAPSYDSWAGLGGPYVSLSRLHSLVRRSETRDGHVRCRGGRSGDPVLGALWRRPCV